MKTIEEVDDLVIGAGLCGLMYALTAVQEGRRVAITEAHYKAGGYATNFSRNKRQFLFDCSQHKITGIRNGNGNLRDAMERIGVWDLVEFHAYTELTTIVYKGRFLQVPSDAEDIKYMLLREFPEEEAGILQLFDDIVSYGYQHYMFGRMLLNEYALDKNLLRRSRQLSNITTKEYYRSLFKSEELIEILGAIAIYLGTISNEANAFYFLHFLYTTFYAGQAFVKGTGQHLSTVLAQEFLQRGGKILLKNPVNEIRMKEGADWITIDSKKYVFHAEQVIATCSPHAVVNMVGSEQVDPRFLQLMDSLEPGWGHFCVYAVSKTIPEELGLTSSEYLVVADEGDDCSEAELKADKHYDVFTLSITNYHKIDPDGGNILQFIVLDYANRWFDLDKNEYERRKAEVQERILNRVYLTFPSLENQLLYVESSTPRTNYKYTLSTAGSAFGYKVRPRTNLGFLNNFPMKGIKLVSSWVAGPGYEAAMCLGFTHAKLANASAALVK